ncbi:hypothetical protein JXA80_14335 [bacterium]|nr:hypothetical protein [candidate division CSSED10-310 bacterium]
MNKIRLDDLKKRMMPGSSEVLIAHDGKVYDVSASPLWKTGVHMKRHAAGEDLTRSLDAAPHGSEVLEKFPVIALVDSDPAVSKTSATSSLPGGPETLAHKGLPVMPRGFLGFVLNLHPHPVSVHFPIALSMTAAALSVLGWIFESHFLITAGFTNLIIATIAMPATIATGYLSFHYNYGHRWTRTFRAKQCLSILLFAVALIAILIHWAAPGKIEQPSGWLHAYLILTIMLIPIAGATGYLGGTITFPRR